MHWWRWATAPSALLAGRDKPLLEWSWFSLFSRPPTTVKQWNAQTKITLKAVLYYHD